MHHHALSGALYDGDRLIAHRINVKLYIIDAGRIEIL
jgi:hypothetical protein